MSFSPVDRDEAELLRRLRATPELLERVRRETGPELAVQRALRNEFSDDLVRAALQLSELRERAGAKFSLAGGMWLDRVGLEQATHETVARHKAQRFRGPTWDLCCGLGGDTAALAAANDVIAVDLREAQCLRTAWNAEAYGVASRVQAVCADVERLPFPSGLIHIDPDRRAGGRGRSLRLEDSMPRLEFLQRLAETASGGAIKVSPASNFAGKFPEAEIELVSLAGECKEATIWFGALAQPGLWRATALPSGATLAGKPLDSLAAVGPLEGYLYDPDPAVVRSGLVDLLAETSGFTRLDGSEEYLTSSGPIETPFARGFEVLANLPNNDRHLRSHFRERGYGQLEVKCRHVPIRAEAVRSRLPLGTGEPAVLIFARIEGRTRAVVCRRIPSLRPDGTRRTAERNRGEPRGSDDGRNG